MPRQTIASLELQIEQRDYEATQLRRQLERVRTQQVQQEAALRLMRMLISDALTPLPYEQTDAAADDPPA